MGCQQQQEHTHVTSRCTEIPAPLESLKQPQQRELNRSGTPQANIYNSMLAITGLYLNMQL